MRRRAGTRDGYDQLCCTLAERGYVAATISYRLAPKHRFPAAVHDTKAAVRWLKAHASEYRVDPNRVGVTGGSAGTTGFRDGPPLVMIHALPFDRRLWRGQIERFSNRYTCLAMDLRGWGRAGPGSNPPCGVRTRWCTWR